MKNLTTKEIVELDRIKHAIYQRMSLEDIQNIIRHIKTKITDKKFAYTYAACLLANHNREQEALRMFARNKADVFSSILIDYITETGSFTMVSKVFQDAKPYHIYTQTPLYQTHEKALVENITKFAINNPPPKPAEITIMDIGPGDGELTARYVNAIVELYHIKKVRLVFVDPFEEELLMAAKNCRNKIPVETEIITISAKAQDLTQEQIRQIQNLKPVWFITAALSVHHMPEEQKIPMLRKMRTISNRFILAEVNWNHDLPAKDSPELIYSIVKNYGFFCQGVLHLDVSEEDRKLCLYHFPIDEAINIIKQERASRIDYHTQIPDWKRIAETAGFQVHEPVTTFKYNDNPYMFMMEFFNDIK